MHFEIQQLNLGKKLPVGMQIFQALPFVLY